MPAHSKPPSDSLAQQLGPDLPVAELPRLGQPSVILRHRTFRETGLTSLASELGASGAWGCLETAHRLEIQSAPDLPAGRVRRAEVAALDRWARRLAGPGGPVARLPGVHS